MKFLHIALEEREFTMLKNRKGKKTWRSYVMGLPKYYPAGEKTGDS